MPYISKEKRTSLDDRGLSLPFREDDETGDLTYVVYVAALKYLKAHRDSYQTRAECVAALEAAKLEFYRRVVAPYEDKKIAENGDVV